MQKVAIIGAGQGGLSLIEALKDQPDINIIGVCDCDSAAPGRVAAEKLGIATCDDFACMLRDREKIDLIINVTNDAGIDERLKEFKDPHTEIVHGRAAMFMLALTDRQKRMQEDAQRRIVELRDLYELGLRLSSSTDLQEVYATIIEYATALTETPAGSIAILDENAGEMTLAAAKGFSADFSSLQRWKLRQGGLTSYILNQEEPVILADVGSLKEPVNPALVVEGVKSIIATPLLVRGKIIGILYVDDFNYRKFEGNEASILGLLAGYAALAIEKMKLLDDTRKMAITDGLTGLNNQQEFIKRLEDETSRAQRYRRALSIVELDIDYFKSYNDKHGHLAGNDLLRRLAQTVADNSRATDTCARTGGEEFAIIMPETDYLEAVKLAERLRVMIETMGFGLKGQQQGVTVSMGVASCPEHGKTATELYHAVDQALYRAKEAGRNRVVGFPNEPASGVLLGRG